jgi:hypothetical protein
MRLTLSDKFWKTGADYHIEETALERYSMGSLKAEASVELEQHLLYCETCQDRLTEANAYIRAMKWAVRVSPEAIVQPSDNFRLFQTCAVYALLIIVSVVSFGPSDRRHAPAAITLLAFRGADMEAHGPSGRVLVLQPDIKGLVAAPSYRLEIVNAAGLLIWRGAVSAGERASRTLVPPKSPGLYFVRVSLRSGKLLREYALKLGN